MVRLTFQHPVGAAKTRYKSDTLEVTWWLSERVFL